VQVAGGGLQITMAEQQLDAAQIGACIEKMGSEGVPQHVRAERFKAEPQLLYPGVRS